MERIEITFFRISSAQNEIVQKFSALIKSEIEI